MTYWNAKKRHDVTRLTAAAIAVAALLLPALSYAATPGITGTTFNLVASPIYITQPDGAMIYSWGYGCATGFTPSYLPPQFASVGFCRAGQVPGPTLIVTEGQTVTVNLTNNLPAPVGNTSIVFQGFQVTTGGGTPGLITSEAARSEERRVGKECRCRWSP